MNTFLSILIIAVILGLLITVHELGHFLAARLCKIRVREFAIGMGPVILSSKNKITKTITESIDGELKERQVTEYNGTRFTLRAFPIGGFCDMSEDDSSDDPHHFRNKSIWQKFFVLVAGSLMNFITGLIILMIILPSTIAPAETTTKITKLMDGFPYTEQILVGDTIIRINNEPVHSYVYMNWFLSRLKTDSYDFVWLRDGEKITVNNVQKLVETDTGKRFGFYCEELQSKAFGASLKRAWHRAFEYVGMVRYSLADLFTGNAKVTDMMGPVGMTQVTSQIVEAEAPFGAKAYVLLDMAALLAINLAVMNLLPIPALDGGRIIFLFISAFLMLVRKRPLSANIEGAIHGITYLLLIGFMVFVVFVDVRRIVGK